MDRVCSLPGLVRCEAGVIGAKRMTGVVLQAGNEGLNRMCFKTGQMREMQEHENLLLL